jgi:hypothetical protein
MKKTNEMLNMGCLGTRKAAISIKAIVLVCTAGIVNGIRRKKAKALETSSVKVVNYVFFNMEGKPVTLSQQDVFDIKQMHEDGVLPTIIGEKVRYGYYALSNH